MQELAVPAGSTECYPSAIAASGGKEYVALDCYFAAGQFAYRRTRSGESAKLEVPEDAERSYVDAIAVSDSSVRYVGYYIPLEGERTPCFWNENGNRTDLDVPEGLSSVRPNSAVFIGSDFYVGGWAMDRSTSFNSLRGIYAEVGYHQFYWKNGVAAMLAAPVGYELSAGDSGIQNADGRPAYVGTVIDANDDHFYCAWVDGDTLIVGPAVLTKN